MHSINSGEKTGCVVSVLSSVIRQVLVSVYFSHLRTISYRCGIYLSNNIRVTREQIIRTPHSRVGEEQVLASATSWI